MRYEIYVWTRRHCKSCDCLSRLVFTTGVFGAKDSSWINTVRQSFRDRGIATVLVTRDDFELTSGLNRRRSKEEFQMTYTQEELRKAAYDLDYLFDTPDDKKIATMIQAELNRAVELLRRSRSAMLSSNLKVWNDFSRDSEDFLSRHKETV